MDKLQPLIKHRFWICFGFAVIFATVGWWKANGALAELTSARMKTVEASFASSVKGGDAPNQEWITESQAVNTSDRSKYTDASSLLWKRQKEVREFPPELRDEMRGIKYMDPIPQLSTRRKWGAEYGKQFENTLKVVHPFQHQDGTGQVIVDFSRLTHVDYNTWKLRPPTSDEIWKNQEDIWLLKSLLTSLARVNDGATRLTESGLREILQLQLRGGVRDAPLAPVAGGAGSPNSRRGGGDPDDDVGGSAPMLTTGAGGGAWAAFEAPLGFDFVSEEFGPLAGVGAAGAQFGNPDIEDNATNFSAGPGGRMPEMKRYVDDTDGMPYKTRAFFLNVRIRESDVPRLLAELTDSSFPVEIVRVDMNIGGSVAGSNPSGYGGGGGGRNADDEEDGGGAFSRGAMFGGGGGGGGAGGGGGPTIPLPAGVTPGITRQRENLSPAARAKAQKDALIAQQTMSAAMSDPTLIQVRVGGLMTLYQSKEEAESQTSTEAAASVESGGAPAAAPVQPAAPAETAPAAGNSAPAGNAPATTVPDPAATDPATTDPAATDPAATDPAATDPAATDPAATDPAATDPAATETTKPDPATSESVK